MGIHVGRGKWAVGKREQHTIKSSCACLACQRPTPANDNIVRYEETLGCGGCWYQLFSF